MGQLDLAIWKYCNGHEATAVIGMQKVATEARNGIHRCKTGLPHSLSDDELQGILYLLCSSLNFEMMATCTRDNSLVLLCKGAAALDCERGRTV